MLKLLVPTCCLTLINIVSAATFFTHSQCGLQTRFLHLACFGRNRYISVHSMDISQACIGNECILETSETCKQLSSTVTSVCQGATECILSLVEIIGSLETDQESASCFAANGLPVKVSVSYTCERNVSNTATVSCSSHSSGYGYELFEVNRKAPSRNMSKASESDDSAYMTTEPLISARNASKTALGGLINSLNVSKDIHPLDDNVNKRNVEIVISCFLLGLILILIILAAVFLLWRKRRSCKYLNNYIPGSMHSSKENEYAAIYNYRVLKYGNCFTLPSTTESSDNPCMTCIDRGHLQCQGHLSSRSNSLSSKNRYSYFNTDGTYEQINGSSTNHERHIYSELIPNQDTAINDNCTEANTTYARLCDGDSKKPVAIAYTDIVPKDDSIYSDLPAPSTAHCPAIHESHNSR